MTVTTGMIALIGRYVSERVGHGHLSPATAETYRRHLGDLARHLGERTPPQVHRRHIEAWLNRPDASIAYRRALLSTASGFFEWCVVLRYCPRNPCAGIPHPKITRGPARHFNADEVAATLDACPDTRARLIVLLMVQEGLRRGEVAALMVDDWDRARGSIDVRGKGGRGKVTRRIPLSDQTRRAIDNYLAEHPATAGVHMVRSYTRPTEGIGPTRVTQLVRVALVDAGVKRSARDGKSAHAFRHTMATDAVANGADIRKLQRVMGHASVTTTEWYLRSDVGDLAEAIGGRSYG